MLPVILMSFWSFSLNEVLASSSSSSESLNISSSAPEGLSSTTTPQAPSSPQPAQRNLGFGLGQYCPSIENAVSTCPMDTNYFYYSCCGGANMYCCENIQTWLLSSLVVLAICLAVMLVICFVRCCCSYKRRTQQSYSFGDK